MILVVGTGRSGTTAVSRVLQERLGVDMGGPGRTSPSNPIGDYENREFRNEIDIPFARAEIDRAEWVRRAEEFAAGMDEPWGIKDPRNALFLDMVLQTLEPDHVVWAWRRPDHVFASHERWYGHAPERHWAQIGGRLAALSRHLQARHYTFVDMTERWAEDELARFLREDLGL